MGGGVIEGGGIPGAAGPGVGVIPEPGPELLGGVAGWVFGDVVRFTKANVQWQASGLTEESVAWV